MLPSSQCFIIFHSCIFQNPMNGLFMLILTIILLLKIEIVPGFPIIEILVQLIFHAFSFFPLCKIFPEDKLSVLGLLCQREQIALWLSTCPCLWQVTSLGRFCQQAPGKACMKMSYSWRWPPNSHSTHDNVCLYNHVHEESV